MENNRHKKAQITSTEGLQIIMEKKKKNYSTYTNHLKIVIK